MPMDTEEHFSMVFEEDVTMADTLWPSSLLLLDDTAPIMPNDEYLLPWGGVSPFDPLSSEVAATTPNEPHKSIQPSLLDGMEASVPEYDSTFNYPDVDIDFTLDWVHAERPFHPHDSVSERGAYSDKGKPSLPSRTSEKQENQTEKIRRITINQQQKQILTNWITRNSEPYPSREDKANLATATGLSIDQVSGWFTRTRQRQLQRIQSNAPVLNLSGTSLLPTIYHGCTSGQAARMPNRVPSPGLPDSVGNDRCLPSCFYLPRCTSLSPRSKESFINNSPKRTRSLPHIFTLDCINTHASAISQASQRQLSLDVAAPTYESGHSRHNKPAIEVQSLTSRETQGLIHPLKANSNTSFVEAWVEDVARYVFATTADPLDITCQTSPNQTQESAAKPSQISEQGFEQSGKIECTSYHTTPGQTAGVVTPSASTYSRMSLTKISNLGGSSNDHPVRRPDQTALDGGTYVCTHYDCTLRFDTPTLLEKHNREVHGSILSSNIQNWSHRCERSNPSTGKPCNTSFSNPYDLTRHEYTIHNAKIMRYQCANCTEEKLFSREDAMKRHIRTVHPDIFKKAQESAKEGRRTNIGVPALFPPADDESSFSAGYRDRGEPSMQNIDGKPAAVHTELKQRLIPWAPEPPVNQSVTQKDLNASRSYSHTEAAYDAISSAASSVDSNGSVASYMSFGPRKGRRVAFQRSFDENSNSLDVPPPTPFNDQYSPGFLSILSPGKSDTVSDNGQNQMMSDTEALDNLSRNNVKRTRRTNNIKRTRMTNNIKRIRMTNNIKRSRVTKIDGSASQRASYQCTFCRCFYQRYYTWKRHEESAHIAPYVWICRSDMFQADSTHCPLCVSSSNSEGTPSTVCPHKFRECWQKPDINRTFYRRDLFIQHIFGVHFNAQKDCHPVGELLKYGRCEGKGPSPSDLICHFCGFRAESWQVRCQHIRRHFENGETMNSWILGGPYVINTDGSTLEQSPAERRQSNTLTVNGQGEWLCRVRAFGAHDLQLCKTNWTCVICGTDLEYNNSGSVPGWGILNHLNNSHNMITSCATKKFSTAESYINHLLMNHHGIRGDWMRRLVLFSFHQTYKLIGR
ncbi:hypothetical protein F5B22DRAFT_398578 [Xylaria bambusicola]|uniref:uncharacterized protein n=1 Tax=Xylaria bambusicola TaxID=326684 RepID=UPI002008A897|nr:uncharacterized protein F5B22DRAFT_398578 [Xylaria bambusicola]KAI0508467.1 hypothetical protein F5B22DRAFT_398578 [Xylaria bambusicola]